MTLDVKKRNGNPKETANQTKRKTAKAKMLVSNYQVNVMVKSCAVEQFSCLLRLYGIQCVRSKTYEYVLIITWNFSMAILKTHAITCPLKHAHFPFV